MKNNHHKSVIKLQNVSPSLGSSYCSDYSSELKDFDDSISDRANKIMVSIDKRDIKHVATERTRSIRQMNSESTGKK